MYTAKFLALIRQSKSLSPGPTSETIFALGARAYYENPTSDLLAFFLDPAAPHGMRDLFLKALLEAGGWPSRDVDLSLDRPPEREVVTGSGNRIDILLQGSGWTLAVENKVYAKATNPFNDYVTFVEGRQEYHAPHRFVVLSAYDFNPPLPWRFVSYATLVSGVESELGRYFIDSDNPKWLLFAREFLLLLRSLCQEGGMDQQHRQFVEEHYADIRTLSRMRAEYHKWILIEGARRLVSSGCWGGEPPVTASNDWGLYGQALRFYPNKIPSLADSNVTLVIGESGSIIPHVYLSGQSPTASARMANALRADGMPAIASVETEARGRVTVYKFGPVTGAEVALAVMCQLAAAIGSGAE